MSKGKLIVLEGLDGSGKATQAKLLAEHLAAQGGELNVVFVVAVAHSHAARLHVVLRQHVFYVFNGEPQHSKLIRVGHNL